MRKFLAGLANKISIIAFMGVFSAASHGADLKNWPSWMAAIKEGTTLSRLSMPGSHDSGSFKLEDPVKQVWAMTQDRNFVDQMNNGVRFFDIRVRATSDQQIVLHHGAVYLYVTLHEFLSDVRGFLKDHPTETIIMSIKEDHPPMEGVTKRTAEIFRDNYYNSDIFYKGSSLNPTIGETRGKVVLFNRMSNANLFSGFQYAGWPDNQTFSLKTNREQLTLNVQDEYNVSYEAKKKSIQSFLTETNKDSSNDKIFINFISLASGGTKFSSPYYFAGYLNPETAQFIQTHVKNRAGWVVMDYAGNEWSPKLYQSVILTNSQLTQ